MSKKTLIALAIGLGAFVAGILIERWTLKASLRKKVSPVNDVTAIKTIIDAL